MSKMLKLKYFLPAILALSFSAAAAWAVDARLVSTDVTVVLRPDGKAQVFYRTEWEVSSGTMSGFYFEGEAFDPVWNFDRCFADLDNGTRVALKIDPMGGNNKFDVILAGGKRFSGRAYYNLSYAGDFAARSLVGTTVNDAGENLVYFDWAPVEWDYGQDHQVIRLVLPVVIAAEKLTQAEWDAVPMLTEEYVNSENKIDYYGTKGDDGQYYLTAQFYKEKPPAYESTCSYIFLPDS